MNHSHHNHDDSVCDEAAIATIVMLCVPSVLTFLYGPQVASSLPMPSAGFAERAGGYVWVVPVGVLMVLSLRGGGTSHVQQPKLI